MASSPSNPPRVPRRPPRPGFRPRFTLMLLYLFGFFLLYCFVLVAPQLLDVLATVAPGPEQEEAAKQAARAAIRGKLLPAFLLAVLTVGLGGYYQVLPGLRDS